jgi:hypothetical protein
MLMIAACTASALERSIARIAIAAEIGGQRQEAKGAPGEAQPA